MLNLLRLLCLGVRLSPFFQMLKDISAIKVRCMYEHKLYYKPEYIFLKNQTGINVQVKSVILKYITN